MIAVVATFVAGVVGFTLLLAALSKALDRRAVEVAIQNFALPDILDRHVSARRLVYLELALALVLLASAVTNATGMWYLAGSACFVVFAAFALGIVRATWLGSDFSCSCFGPSHEIKTLSYWHAARAGALAALALGSAPLAAAQATTSTSERLEAAAFAAFLVCAAVAAPGIRFLRTANPAPFVVAQGGIA